jgi:hypothetical protein
MTSTATTTASLDTQTITLHPSTPPQYLQRMIMTTLHRKGFESAEAGALAEMERLLENRWSKFKAPLEANCIYIDVQSIFTRAMNHANLSGRTSSNAIDLLESQETTSWPSITLRNESKRHRKRMSPPYAFCLRSLKPTA